LNIEGPLLAWEAVHEDGIHPVLPGLIVRHAWDARYTHAQN